MIHVSPPYIQAIVDQILKYRMCPLNTKDGFKYPIDEHDPLFAPRYNVILQPASRVKTLK